MPEDPANPRGNGASYLYMAAAFVVVVAGMRAAAAIVNPLLLAIFLSVVSAPAYLGLIRRGISNWLSLLIVIGVLSVVVLSVVFVVTDSIAGFTSRHVYYRDLLNERTEALQRRFDELISPSDPETSDPETSDSETSDTETSDTETSDTESSDPETPDPETPDPETSDPDTSDPETTLLDSVLTLNGDRSTSGDTSATESPPDPAATWREFLSEQFSPGAVISLAASVAGSIGQLLGKALLILIAVIFILLEVGTFTRKVRAAFSHTDEAAARGQKIVRSMHDYIVIKTWVSLATGVLILIMLKVIGVPYAVLWGLLAFLFNFIPNIGSIIASVPTILIAWLELGTLPAVAVGVSYLIVNVSMGNLLEPRLMGHGLGLSPLVVFCSMVFWGWTLGPVGMLLSVPLTMAARIAMESFEDTRWIAILMGKGN